MYWMNPLILISHLRTITWLYTEIRVSRLKGLKKFLCQAVLEKLMAAAQCCAIWRLNKKLSERCVPENEVIHFELGLYHASRPQSYSQNIRLCGHVIWRRDAGHVLKETAKWGRGGEERKRGAKRWQAEEKWGEKKTGNKNLISCRETWDQKRINQVSVTSVSVCVCVCAREPGLRWCRSIQM